MIPARKVRRDQLRHFGLLTVLPLLISILAVGWMILYPPDATAVVMLLLMWALTGGLGVSVGFHRLLTHRSFKTHAAVETALAVLGSMAGNGPVTYWVAIHRRHHRYSDEEGDPHSPCLSIKDNCRSLPGLLHAHIGWTLKHDIPAPTTYAKDVLRRKHIALVNHLYLPLIVGGLVLPAAAGFFLWGGMVGIVNGFLYGGVLRLVLGNHLIWAVNSICHSFGYRNFKTGDSSTNNWFLAIPTFGESWHNNHHASPSSAVFGRRWWERLCDSGYIFIRVLETLRLARNVNTSVLQMPLTEQTPITDNRAP